MRACILSIGDEVVFGPSADTNGRWLAGKLLERSVVTEERRTVPDDRRAIAAAIAQLAHGRGLLILTGGLGPTHDDLTREALGDVFTPGEPMLRDEQAERAVEAWFAGRGRPMPEANRRQARRPRTMRLLENPGGTAPGLAGRLGGCEVFALPGPPPEMRLMYQRHVVPRLPSGPDIPAVLRGTVNLYGLGESHAAERLGPLAAPRAETTVGITAARGIITARIVVRGPREAAREKLEAAQGAVERAWAPYAYGRGRVTLSQAVGDLLRGRAETLATAESCTGGGLGAAIVRTPGASACYRGGWVAYANDMKVRCLGVPESVLRARGAVSAAAAAAMAGGALEGGEATIALAITGIAGPGGEGPGRPAGLVYVALARRGRGEARVRRFVFPGDRRAVQERSVTTALQVLRLALVGAADDLPLIWEEPQTGGEPRGAGP